MTEEDLMTELIAAAQDTEPLGLAERQDALVSRLCSLEIRKSNGAIDDVNKYYDQIPDVDHRYLIHFLVVAKFVKTTREETDISYTRQWMHLYLKARSNLQALVQARLPSKTQICFTTNAELIVNMAVATEDCLMWAFPLWIDNLTQMFYAYKGDYPSWGNYHALALLKVAEVIQMYETLSMDLNSTFDKEKIKISLNLFNQKMYSLLPLCDQLTLAYIKSQQIFQDDSRPYSKEIKSYINIAAPIAAELI